MEENKKNQIDKDRVIKIVSIIIMIGIVILLASKSTSFFDKTKIKPNSTTENSQGIYEAVKNNSVSESNEESKTVQAFNHRLISPEEYKEKLESGEYVHIDIRTPQEYNEEKIAEGLNIDFNASDFKEQLDKLDKSKKYIYHCRSGSRSARAVPVFEELGFGEILELQGGINNWKTKFETL